MPVELKTKEERVKDTVKLLLQLKDIGIPSTDPGYLETKKHLDAWIQDGETREVKVPFPRALRIGHLMLPRITGRAPTFVLKATDELKWKLREQSE